MKHLSQAVSALRVVILSVLMFTPAAYAQHKCTGPLVIKGAANPDCVIAKTGKEKVDPANLDPSVYAPLAHSAHAGFEVSKTQASSAAPESISLLVLIGALLGALLIRAKRHNTK